MGEHEEHDDDVHEEHPEVFEAITDISFFTFALPQPGQEGAFFALMGTRASNSWPHALHLYS